MSRKKPTIKELNQIVLENREGINLAFKSIEENRAFVLGIDKLLDWYIEYKEEINLNRNQRIQTELRTVYLINNKTFLKRAQARLYQKKLSNYKQVEDKMVNDLQKIIEQLLDNNNWGLYFKANPLEQLPSQDGQHIYQVNNVSKEEVSTAIVKAIQDDLQKNID